MLHPSPLRYPGGKAVMANFFREFIASNGMQNVIYAEPYAGGAGAAIDLLLSENVDRIILNDASVAIYSFWDSLVNSSDDFLALFDRTEPNLKNWKKQREIFCQYRETDKVEPSLELGFATFFLNRCNRSGILYAGPIGGNSYKKQREAPYKINARYNKKGLRKRLKKIIKHSSCIQVHNEDAIDFMKKHIQTLSSKKQGSTLVYLDPPYYVKGKNLYLNYYQEDGHIKVADYLKKKHRFKWLLSYDNIEAIQKLYSDLDLYTFNLSYSVGYSKEGKEMLICNKDLNIPFTPITKKECLKKIAV